MPFDDFLKKETEKLGHRNKETEKCIKIARPSVKSMLNMLYAWLPKLA